MSASLSSNLSDANASNAAAASTPIHADAPLSSSSSSGVASPWSAPSTAPADSAAAALLFNFSSRNSSAFDLESAAGSSSASAQAASLQRVDGKSAKTESGPPLAVVSDPFSAMNHSAFGHSSVSTFSSGSAFPSSQSFASANPPSGFGFASGGFAALSSIPTKIQSNPAVDSARSALSALSFDLAPKAKPHVFPRATDLSDAETAAASQSQPAASLPNTVDINAAAGSAVADARDRDMTSALKLHVSDPVPRRPVAAIVPAGAFGAPVSVSADALGGSAERLSRSEQPMPDGRTPVLPADAFFSIARFLTLADVNTLLRSSRGGFAAQLSSLPCIGLSHRVDDPEDLPVRSLVLYHHVSALSLTLCGRQSWLSRVAVQLPSLRSLKLFRLPTAQLRWKVPLPRLTSLDLGSPHFGPCHVSGLAENLPGLRDLVLSSAVAPSMDLAPFVSLHSLSLPLSDDLKHVEAIRSLVGLRVLTFMGSGRVAAETAEQTLQSLTRQPHAMQLEEIVCDSQPWTDAMIEAAGRMPSLTALRPSRVGCSRLSALRQLPLLSSLHLLFASFIARITPEDVVSALQSCGGLTALTLGGDCMLRREHLSPIFTSLPALRELEVSLVDDLASFADAQSTLSRSLVKLTLRPFNALEPPSLEPDFMPLVGLRSLRTLHLLEWWGPLSQGTLLDLRPPESFIPSLREFVFQDSGRFAGAADVPYRARGRH